MATTVDRTAYNLLVDDDGSGNTGSVIDKATFLNVVLNPVDALLTANVVFDGTVTERGRSRAMGEWASYTPTWSTFSDPQPVLGNGSLQGRYTTIGTTVYYRIGLTLGSTSTTGNGFFLLSTPSNAVDYGVGSIYAYEATLGEVYTGVGVFFATGSLSMYCSTTKAIVTPTSPFTFNAGDFIVASGFYSE